MLNNLSIWFLLATVVTLGDPRTLTKVKHRRTYITYLRPDSPRNKPTAPGRIRARPRTTPGAHRAWCANLANSAGLISSMGSDSVSLFQRFVLGCHGCSLKSDIGPQSIGVVAGKISTYRSSHQFYDLSSGF